jgi:hypothetical protein
MSGRGVAEGRVGIAERAQRAGQRFEQRLEPGKAALGGARLRPREPRRCLVARQNDSVPRTLIGIM